MQDTLAQDRMQLTSPGRHYLASVPMGRRVDVEQLVGASEIAQRLGLAQVTTVHSWRRRHEDFPAPVASLHAALVWHWPDVERWARATGRLP